MLSIDALFTEFTTAGLMLEKKSAQVKFQFIFF